MTCATHCATVCHRVQQCERRRTTASSDSSAANPTRPPPTRPDPTRPDPIRSFPTQLVDLVRPPAHQSVRWPRASCPPWRVHDVAPSLTVDPRRRYFYNLANAIQEAMNLQTGEEAGDEMAEAEHTARVTPPPPLPPPRYCRCRFRATAAAAAAAVVTATAAAMATRSTNTNTNPTRTSPPT